MPIGLVLGGGAPNLPLMTGALLALDEAGIDFKVITTTGAGMVVGLLYAAPRKQDSSLSWKKTRRAALRATRDWGIDDAIYEMVPVNYKIFQKPGAMARAFSNATNPFLWSIPRESRRQRLLGDGLALMATMMSPSDLSPSSKGLCQPPPWIEMLVDFDELKQNMAASDTKFRLSAYCIEDGEERTFHRDEITADHFKAALAMPFIYAPYHLSDAETGEQKTYLEGSAFNTLALNPDDVMVENDIDTVIFFDIMGNRHLIGEPRWLVDAWGKSIIAPLTRLAEQGLEVFKNERELHQREREIDELEKILDLADTDWEEFKRRRDDIKRKRDFHDLVNLFGLGEHDAEEFEECVDEFVNANPELDLKDLNLKNYVELAKQNPEKFKEIREKHLREFERRVMGDRDDNLAHASRTELLRMPFRDHIPEDHWPEVLDWTHSNMSKLFDIGVETGRAFVETHRERLERSMGKPPKTLREPVAAEA